MARIYYDVDLHSCSLSNIQMPSSFLSNTDNEFTGPIPSEIGALTGMTNFQFIGNQFTGQMPQEICNLNEASGGVLESMIADCNDDNFACDVPTCCTGFLPGCPGTV
jgi:hypothetical protein